MFSTGMRSEREFLARCKKAWDWHEKLHSRLSFRETRSRDRVKNFSRGVSDIDNARVADRRMIARYLKIT